MSPIIEVILFLACLVAAFVWLLLYFFLIEGVLKRLVGSIFGISIGGSELTRTSYMGRTKFYISGWRISEPKSSGCMFDLSIWGLGAVLRAIFIGVPVAVLLLLALYLVWLVTRP